MGMGHYLFKQPEAFALFIPWLYLVYFLMFKKKKNKAAFKASSIKNFKRWENRGRVIFLKLNEIVLLISNLFFITALARPQLAESQVKRSIDGIDIVIVLV